MFLLICILAWKKTITNRAKTGCPGPDSYGVPLFDSKSGIDAERRKKSKFLIPDVNGLDCKPQTLTVWTVARYSSSGL